MGDEKISIKNKALILSVCLIVIFMMGAVSAANQTDVIDAKETDAQDVITSDIAEDEPLGENQQSPAIKDSPQIQTTIKSDDSNIVKGEEFSVQLTDNASAPIANKQVKFTFNNKTTNASTDGKGIAKLLIDSDPGQYTVK